MILFNEMYQHLEDPQNSVKQYFPNDQYIILQNQAWLKDSQVQDRPMDQSFKNSDMVLCYTSQITFKELPLKEFWCIVKEKYPQLSEKGKKKVSSIFQLHTCKTPDFLHILQPK